MDTDYADRSPCSGVHTLRSFNMVDVLINTRNEVFPGDLVTA